MSDHKINIQEQFKSRLAPVVACIKEKLQRDVGTSNAYDIIAVAQGIKDYQTAKGRSKKPFYTLRANIGTKAEPMYVIENLGHLDKLYEAQDKAKLIASKCNISLKWDLCLDDKYVGYTYCSEPTVDKGLLCNISLTSNDLVGLEDALDEVKRLISEGNEEGFNKNETTSFEFDVFGENYEFGDEFDIEVEFDFAIVDGKNVHSISNDEGEINAYFQEYISTGTIRGDEISGVDGDTLYLCEQATMKEAEDDIYDLDHTFLAVTVDASSLIVTGSADVILGVMNKESTYHFYKIIEKTGIKS